LFRDRFRRRSDCPSRLAVSGIALPSDRDVVNDQRQRPQNGQPMGVDGL
jgi:hypothetical protein